MNPNQAFLPHQKGTVLVRLGAYHKILQTWGAYRQQKFLCHSSGGWEVLSKSEVPAPLCSGSEARAFLPHPLLLGALRSSLELLPGPRIPAVRAPPFRLKHHPKGPTYPCRYLRQ